MTTPDPDAPSPQDILDAEFADAIADDQRWPTWDVAADWYHDDTYNHPLSKLSRQFEVLSLSISRELSGDLPPEVGLVEGRTAAALEVTLAARRDPATGEVDPDSTDPIAAFAPYDPTAPLYGVPTVGAGMTADLGFETASGPQSRRRFTGTVASVTPSVGASAADDTVKLTALDGAWRMHAPITQQATGMDGVLAARYGPERYNSRTNSHWLVDRIFRANGFYASPPPQPNSFISATCHGSTFPEIGGHGVPRRVNIAIPDSKKPDGTFGRSTAFAPLSTAWVGGHGAGGDHPYDMMYANPEGQAQNGVWTSPQVLTMNPGDGFGCSGLFRMPSNPVSAYLFGVLLSGGPVGLGGVSGGDFAVVVYFEGGQPSMYVYTPTNGLRGVVAQIPRPSKPEWHHLGFHWSFRAPTDITTSPTTNIPVDCVLNIAIDGDTFDPFTYRLNIGNARQNKWAPSTTVEYNMGGGIRFTNVSWFSAPICPTDDQWVGPRHRSMADVDPGMNELTGLPQLSGEDSWDLLAEVAGAEAAQLGFGGALHDRPYFKSRAVPRDRSNPTVLTADRDLATVVSTTDESAVRNSISSAVTPLLIGDYEWVKESKDVTEFEAGPGATYFPVTLPPDTVLVEPWYILQFGNRASWEAFADDPLYRDSWLFECVYADNPRQVVPSTNQPVSLGLFPGGPGQVLIGVYNFTGRTIRFATEDQVDQQGVLQRGSAAFKLPGRLLTAQGTQPQNITDPGSISLFGERTYELGGGSNRWHQYDAAIAGVAEAILTTTAHPTPLLDTVTVPHDPRRDLDQPVRLVCPRGLGSVRGTIAAQTTTITPDQAVLDELSVRPIAPPGFGVLEDGELGQVGITLRFGA